MIRLGACLCFKNSAEYLAEWLGYYHALGVERFYLYNNESTDDWQAVVKPYVARGVAEVFNWPGTAQQSAIYDDCLRRARGKVQWVSFMDDDEFVWPALDPDLPTALRRYEHAAGVAACWILYGSSYHERKPDALVMESYTWRCHAVDGHVKCIVQPERIVSPKMIGHAFNPVAGFTIVDEHGRPIDDARAAQPSGDILRVNHYITKSMEELRRRRTQPRADSGRVSEHPLSLWESWARDWNQAEDRGIMRFLDRVKTTMKQFS